MVRTVAEQRVPQQERELGIAEGNNLLRGPFSVLPGLRRPPRGCVALALLRHFVRIVVGLVRAARVD
jgi:hypothetical protein